MEQNREEITDYVRIEIICHWNLLKFYLKEVREMNEKRINAIKGFTDIILVAALVLLSNCKFIEGKEFLKIIIIDNSLSTADLRKYYINDFEKILASLEPGDRIIIYPVNSQPLNRPELELKIPAVRGENQLKRTISEVDIKTKKIPAIRDELMRRMKEIINMKNLSQKTDLLFALYNVAGFIKSGEKTEIYIISDMVNDSEYANFNHLDLDSTNIAKLINKIKKDSFLPDFKGASVYVTGVYNSNGLKFIQIKNFWYEYFRQASAKLKTYSVSIN